MSPASEIDWEALLGSDFASPTLDRLPRELLDGTAFLSFLTISIDELDVILRFRSKMYKRYSVPKRSGKSRLISAPNDRLSYLQKRSSQLLKPLYRPRRVVHGFVDRRSILTNAKSHVGRSHILNIDLEDFFPSITESRVLGLLEAIGIEGSIAEALSKIFTVSGRLPQGAPSSPLLSNMICLGMDRSLMQYAKSNRIRYTRYADDLTFSTFASPRGLFSGEIPLPSKVPVEAISKSIRSIVGANGFTINEEKIRYFGPKSRREVTGLTVNEFPNVHRQFVRVTRSILHSISTKGEAEAQRVFSEKHHTIKSIRLHVRGRIEWIAHIKGRSDPVFRKLARRFNILFPGDAVLIGPSLEDIHSRAVLVIDVEYPPGYKDSNGDDLPCAQGTGFFLEGYGFLTAAHCVLDAQKIEVYAPGGPKSGATVRFIDVDRDLALLEVLKPPPDFAQLSLADHPVPSGSSVNVLGYPDYGPGDQLSDTPGHIVSLPRKSGVRMMAVSQSIHPGNSGGPLLASDGSVIAVAHKGGHGEVRNLGVNIQELVQLREGGVI